MDEGTAVGVTNEFNRSTLGAPTPMLVSAPTVGVGADFVSN